MNCPHCGKENFDTAHFCRYCGVSLIATADEEDQLFVGLVGRKDVKTEVRDVVKTYEALSQHQKSRQQTLRLNNNFLITGGPGTGKTLLVETIQRILHGCGMLSLESAVRIDASELGTWLGEYKLAEIKGGIVCIENVHLLVPAGAADEDQVRLIDSLFAHMEHWGNDPIVILTGLPGTFDRFIDANPVVSNRFAHRLKLTKYDIDDLIAITRLKLNYWGYGMDIAAEEKLRRIYKNDLRNVNNVFENGHLVQRRTEDIIKRVALRSKNATLVIQDDVIGTEYKLSSAADILKELDRYVGIDQIRNLVSSQIDGIMIEKRRNRDSKPQIKDHYLFLGNPGTGKTTIARIMADIFSALEVLPIGQLVEVSRQNLVAGYVGQTAARVEAAVDKAMGGVLFIDEAYTLKQNEYDTFGQEAIDTLLKLMEDRRGKFVVIAAGYTKEMEQFVSSNPGLSSRFTQKIDFRDYTADELAEIFCRMVKGANFLLDASAQDYVPQFFNRMYVSRTKNFANARNVRIAFEATLRHQTDRLRALLATDSDAAAQQSHIITASDIEGPDNRVRSLKDVLSELDSLIGMDSVKETIRHLTNKIIVEKKMEEMKLANARLEPIHIVLTGNPGTGKTTIAKKLGEIFQAIGLLPDSKVVCKERKDLISPYQNETARLVDKACDEAMGGILFIDEAYSLMPVSNSGSKDQSGVEAVESLMTRMVSDAGKFVVVCAGYKKEMDEFVREANPGFARRFSHRLHIEDYTSQQLSMIFRQIAQKNGDMLTPEASELLDKKIEEMVLAKDENFGNVGEIVKLHNEVLSRRSNRIASLVMSGAMLDRDTMLTVLPEDIPYDMPKSVSVNSCLAQLNDLVGLQNVKQEIMEMVSLINMQKMRSEQQGIPFRPQNEHYLFTGNPGTGKTTVARIMADIFYTLGMLPTNRLTEVTRKDLVAPYVGQSAPQTNRAVKSAIGGVFFIDEAYTLNQGPQDAFGQEATDTLLPALIDYRDRMICIAAGYSDEMQQWVESNPGLPSRFTRTIHFEDYDGEEMFEIFERLCQKEHYVLAESAKAVARSYFQTLYDNRGSNFANAREVNNAFLHIKKRQSLRLQYRSVQPDFDHSELNVILEEDII